MASKKEMVGNDQKVLTYLRDTLKYVVTRDGLVRQGKKSQVPTKSSMFFADSVTEPDDYAALSRIYNKCCALLAMPQTTY